MVGDVIACEEGDDDDEVSEWRPRSGAFRCRAK